jgi:hypothetical protein
MRRIFIAALNNKKTQKLLNPYLTPAPPSPPSCPQPWVVPGRMRRMFRAARGSMNRRTFDTFGGFREVWVMRLRRRREREREIVRACVEAGREGGGRERERERDTREREREVY